jgi:hypothetical protein
MKKTLLISIFLLSFSLVVFAWSDSTEKINSYFDVSNDIQRKNGSLIIDGGIEAKMQFNVGGLIKKEQQEDEIVFGTIIIGETEEDNVHFHSFLLDGSLAITGGNPEEWKVLTMMDDNPATWEDLVDVADTEGPATVEDQGWVLSGNTLRLVGENDSVLGGTNMQALSSSLSFGYNNKAYNNSIVFGQNFAYSYYFSHYFVENSSIGFGIGFGGTARSSFDDSIVIGDQNRAYYSSISLGSSAYTYESSLSLGSSNESRDTRLF